MTVYIETMIYAEALRQVGDPDDALAIGAAIGKIDTEQASGRDRLRPGHSPGQAG